MNSEVCRETMQRLKRLQFKPSSTIKRRQVQQKLPILIEFEVSIKVLTEFDIDTSFHASVSVFSTSFSLANFQTNQGTVIRGTVFSQTGTESLVAAIPISRVGNSVVVERGVLVVPPAPENILTAEWETDIISPPFSGTQVSVDINVVEPETQTSIPFTILIDAEYNVTVKGFTRSIASQLPAHTHKSTVFNILWKMGYLANSFIVKVQARDTLYLVNSSPNHLASSFGLFNVKISICPLRGDEKRPRKECIFKTFLE